MLKFLKWKQASCKYGKAMKRNSRNLPDFRELSVGVRQYLADFELALEQPVERYLMVSVDLDGA